MTDVANVVNTVVTGAAQTLEAQVAASPVAQTVETVATGVVQTLKTNPATAAATTAATAEVTSLSTHWHIPVWAVLVVLGGAAWAAVHFLHIVL